MREQLENISQTIPPPFTTHTPPFSEFFEIAARYSNIKHFIIAGRGGSVSSFKAIYGALAEQVTTKRVHILDTNDPSYISYLKRTCPRDETLLVVISKSGTTVDVIENLIALREYEKLIITSNNDNTLKNIQQAHDLAYAEHPNIGGRFSAITSSTLLPATLIYINTQEVAQGMQRMYDLCNPSRDIGNNPALELAATLYLLEKKGHTEIFAPLYGREFMGFDELIIQLMHETVCKEKQGQSVFASPAPESQHHTNQRMFGGRENIVIIPHASQKSSSDIRLDVPYEYQDVELRDATLNILEGESLHQALLYEFDGVCEDALARKIPLCTITLDAITPHNIGELIAFWQYVAIYSALMRGVNPYDQPQVESSKNKSFEHRREH